MAKKRKEEEDGKCWKCSHDFVATNDNPLFANAILGNFFCFYFFPILFLIIYLSLKCCCWGSENIRKTPWTLPNFIVRFQQQLCFASLLIPFVVSTIVSQLISDNDWSSTEPFLIVTFDVAVGGFLTFTYHLHCHRLFFPVSRNAEYLVIWAFE